jgi:hypothetical protein
MNNLKEINLKLEKKNNKNFKFNMIKDKKKYILMCENIETGKRFEVRRYNYLPDYDILRDEIFDRCLG